MNKGLFLTGFLLHEVLAEKENYKSIEMIKRTIHHGFFNRWHRGIGMVIA